MSPPQAERAIAPGLSRAITAERPIAREKWAETQAIEMCRKLEAGQIVFLPQTPIEIPADHRKLLLGWNRSSSKYHKNIAYRPLEDRVTGLDKREKRNAENLQRVLREYSQRSVEFLREFLTPYAAKWKMELASFRTMEENGRPARLHAQ